MICCCSAGRLLARTHGVELSGARIDGIAGIVGGRAAPSSRAPSHQFSDRLDEVAATALIDAWPSNQRTLQMPIYSDGQ